ncbi:MAG: hypothetical protein WCW27_01165 [Patescibacteria group bacterium]
MHQIIKTKFIEKEGHWFNIVKYRENSYSVVNTQRKRMQNERDGIDYEVENFDNLKDAESYLNRLANTNFN